MKKIAYILAAVAITAGALGYSLWGADFALLGSLLAGADFQYLVPMFGSLCLFYLFTVLRWNLILRPLGRYTLFQSGPAMMIGFAGNNVFPAHLGELARVMMFSRRFGVSGSSVFATLVVERILDVFAILTCYLLAVLVIDPFPAAILLGVEVSAGVVAVLSLAILFMLRFPRAFLNFYLRVAFMLPSGVRQKGAVMLENATLGMSALKTPGSLTVMLGLSLAKWASNGAMVWLSLGAFNTPVSFSISMIVIALTALAVTLPSAPGYVGAVQAAFVVALVPFGVSQETALAASVVFLVAQWLPVTLFGGVCFAATGMRWREIGQTPS